MKCKTIQANIIAQAKRNSSNLFDVNPQRLSLAESCKCTPGAILRKKWQKNLAHTAVRNGNSQQQRQRGHQISLRYNLRFHLQT